LVAIDLFSLSIVHGLCNGLLLQLIECIELIKIDVKRKMRLRFYFSLALKSPLVTSTPNFFTHYFISSHPHVGELTLPDTPARMIHRVLVLRLGEAMTRHLAQLHLDFSAFLASIIFG
jgi:hypothetical protein